jgi:hypothetical protein
MTEGQLRNQIQEINRGLTALVQLPTTNRLNELCKERQSVKDLEALISDILEEGKKICHGEGKLEAGINPDTTKAERNGSEDTKIRS